MTEHYREKWHSFLALFARLFGRFFAGLLPFQLAAFFGSDRFFAKEFGDFFEFNRSGAHALSCGFVAIANLGQIPCDCRQKMIHVIHRIP
jgi:hypothetical protein